MKKILFSDKFSLTQAVLEGRKTQTRRIINPQPEVSERMGMVWKGYAYGITSPYGSPNFLKDVYHNFLSGTNYPRYRRYKLGEVVAVAQSYKDAGIEPTHIIKQRIRSFKLYPAYANIEAQYTSGWSNKLFVSAGLMKHFIRITNVRVERLNDISDGDCISEGVMENIFADSNRIYYTVEGPKDVCLGKTPREAYAVLMEKISGKGTWESNPYVFVYDFELVKE